MFRLPRLPGAFRFVNSSRYHLALMTQQFAESMTPGGIVLDAGAGDAPYKSLFSHMRYESADFGKLDKEYTDLTYVCDFCEHIPVEDGRFDYILLNQVLEHLPDPQRALCELSRVLKLGGRILVSAPLFFPEHEQPHDYYRYTQFAYQKLFSGAGLEVESVERLEGFFGTAAYMLKCIYQGLPALPKRSYIAKQPALLVVWPIVTAIKVLSYAMAWVLCRLDMKFKLCDIGFPKNYVVLGRKAAQGRPLPLDSPA